MQVPQLRLRWARLLPQVPFPHRALLAADHGAPHRYALHSAATPDSARDRLARRDGRCVAAFPLPTASVALRAAGPLLKVGHTIKAVYGGGLQPTEQSRSLPVNHLWITEKVLSIHFLGLIRLPQFFCNLVSTKVKIVGPAVQPPRAQA